MTVRIITILSCALIAGCAAPHKLQLQQIGGTEQGYGVAGDYSKNVIITIGTREYRGKFIYDGTTAVTTVSAGSATAGNVTAYGRGFSTSYVPGTGNGSLTALSPDGDSLRCEFTYRAHGGIGVCHNVSGLQYDLLILN